MPHATTPVWMDGIGTSVQVALRIRPQLSKEKIEGCLLCTQVTPGEPQVTLGKDKGFTFDYVFDQGVQQDAVYQSCIKQLVEGCFDGYNATVIAYGQTGSGKTYTMGTGFDVTSSPEDTGIIPRAMDHLFDGIKQRKQQATEETLPAPEFCVTATFIELYNEDIIDLFDTSGESLVRGRSTLRIHEDTNGSICIAGISSHIVSSADETLKCLHTGVLSRRTASTQMNSQSSRSHAIFTVKVNQTRAKTIENKQDEDGTILQQDTNNERNMVFESLSAKFTFIDLAGSERLKRTKATGDRAKEGISINCGLLALGNVISALGDVTKKGSHVPYRDSKLTRLLQDSLGGNSRTLMVACISPSDRDFMETLNTLKYANRAKNIKNKVVANQDNDSKQIKILRQHIATLQLELTEYKTGKKIIDSEGVETYNDMFQENNLLQKENNNYRMRMKAMQETIETLKDRIIDLSSQLATAGFDGTNESEISMISSYIKEIEEIRTKYLESELMCSRLKKTFDSQPRFSTPLPQNTNDESLLELAKLNIGELEHKKNKILIQKQPHIAVHSNSERENNAMSGCADDGSSEILDNDSEVSSNASNDGINSMDEADEVTIHEEIENITQEIDLKQELVNKVESMQKRMAAMDKQYMEKLKLLSDQIKATEMERDKVLETLGSHSSADKERENSIRQQYQKQLDQLKKNLLKLQEEQKHHNKLVREQSKKANQLKQLRKDLESMKATKIRLLHQMKSDDKRNKEHDSRRMKEILKLKREFQKKTKEVRTLELKNHQKDLLMKRKQEEVVTLRIHIFILGNLNSTYVVEPSSSSHAVEILDVQAKGELVLPQVVQRKWKSIQDKMNEMILQKETISRIEKQMEHLLKERERLRKNIEKIKPSVRRALCDEQDAMQENIVYVNEQIQNCQLEIMQVEEAMTSDSLLSQIIQNCSLNEARFFVESFVSLTLTNSSLIVECRSRLEEMETRLQESEQSAKQAHELMRYVLEEKPYLNCNISECLTEFIRGTYSGSSSSSRDSSPDKSDENKSILNKPTALLAPIPHIEQDETEITETKELKARRRTATPQELLHGGIQFKEQAVKCEINDSNIKTQECLDETLTSIPCDDEDEVNVISSDLSKLEEIKNIPLETTALKDRIASTQLPRSNSAPKTPEPSSKSSIPTNVFMRLSKYTLSSPMTAKGHMTPISSKTSSVRSSLLDCVQVAKGHHKAVLCIHATDHLLFSGSKDRTVKVWNLVTGQEIMSLEGHPNNVNIVKHCPINGLVYSVSLCYIKVWDIRSHAKCIRVLSSSGGNQLVGNFMRTIPRTNRMPDNESIINDLTLSSDSKMLFCATTTHAKVVELNKFGVIGKLIGHKGNIMTMCIPRLGNSTVITGAKDHFIKVFDLSNGISGNVVPSRTLEPPHMDGVEFLLLSTNENFLFSCSRDKSIKKWDMDTKTVVRSEYGAHGNWICAMDLVRSNNDQELLVSGGRDGLLKLWDMDQLNSVGSVRAHTDTINCIASNNTHLFTASSDRTIQMWKQVQNFK
nr:kinesin-like protein KIF21A [Ciona intestinalis]|eukprot:XP_009858703.1 kinesin-like protein KIF21A [Ciona intestinalis]